MLLALHGNVYICVTKCFHGVCFMVLFHHQIGLGSIRVISERGSKISQIIPPCSEISAGGCSCSIISIPYLVDLAKKDIEIQPGFEPGSSEFRSDALTN